MKWGYPDTLLWLWLALPALFILFYALKRRERLLELLVSHELLPSMAPTRNKAQGRRKVILFLLALVAMVVALAQPKWGFHWEEVKQRGLDITVVLDTSKSMLTEDIKPNRLQQAKWAIRDLLGKLHGDRIGLVAFAGSGFLQCPLTTDYAAFRLTLDDVYVGLIPRGGTAIEQALRRAIDAFDNKSSADKAIVLITDGEDHEGNPLRLLDELRDKNIRVYSVGVGSLEGELIPDVDGQGHPGFLKDRKGQVVKSALKESTLQKLAWETKGAYVRSAPGDFGLERIYEQGIAELQRDERESRMIQNYEHRFVWFLVLAFLLLLAEATLSTRKKINGGEVA